MTGKYIYRMVEVVITAAPKDLTEEAPSDFYIFRYPSLQVNSSRPTGGTFTFSYTEKDIADMGSFDGYDMVFDVLYTDGGNANTAEVRIYNISRELRSSITRRHQMIQISAGYETDFHVIFEGYTDTVYSTFEGLDVVTVIKCSCQTSLLYTDTHNKQGDHHYPPGTRYEDIITDAVKELDGGIIIDYIEPTGLTTTKWETYTGKPYAIIEAVTRRVNGLVIKTTYNKILDDPRYTDTDRVSALVTPQEPDTYVWYIRKNTGFRFEKKGSMAKAPGIEVHTFTVDSGLLSFEPTDTTVMGEESLWVAKLLLSPAVDMHDNIIIQSTRFGEVNPGTKKIEPVGFYAQSIRHTGSTFGVEYYTVISGYTQKTSESGVPTVIDTTEKSILAKKGYTRLDKYLNANVVGG